MFWRNGAACELIGSGHTLPVCVKLKPFQFEPEQMPCRQPAKLSRWGLEMVVGQIRGLALAAVMLPLQAAFYPVQAQGF